MEPLQEKMTAKKHEKCVGKAVYGKIDFMSLIKVIDAGLEDIN